MNAAGYHLAAPGRSATQAYHWPQVGQHPATARQLTPRRTAQVSTAAHRTQALQPTRAAS